MDDDKGEFITESSAQVTKMLRDRFRSAALVFALPAVILLLIGLVMWFVVELQWYIYVVFFVGAGLLFLYSAMLLFVSMGVPSLRIYEGGVLLKPPKGKTAFHPWSDFTGYTRKKMGDLEVIELQLEKGEPISLNKYMDQYDRIGGLVEQNVPRVEG
jgi:hypothetical protein